MEEKITLTEATRRYRIGEKTLRKWINATGLKKEKGNQGRMEWKIEITALEQLIKEKQSTGTPKPVVVPVPDGTIGREQITALASEISYQGEMIEVLKREVEALEQELGTLGERVSVLERGKRKPTQVARADVGYGVPASDKPRTSWLERRKSDKPPLPEGWTSWDAFLKRHNTRADQRNIQALERRDYCQTGVYLLPGGKTVQFALDHAGQDMLLRTLREIQPLTGRLKRCNIVTCPCHGIIEGQGNLWAGTEDESQGPARG